MEMVVSVQIVVWADAIDSLRQAVEGTLATNKQALGRDGERESERGIESETRDSEQKEEGRGRKKEKEILCLVVHGTLMSLSISNQTGVEVLSASIVKNQPLTPTPNPLLTADSPPCIN